MSKFSSKGWDSDFRVSNFTGDQLERYMDGLRDDLHGRRDATFRQGKAIHPHKPFGEAPREFTSDEMFATMLAAAKGGDIQRQYLVGLEFAKRGDLANARIWLKKAADKNWPGAKEKLAEMAGSLHSISPQVPPRSCDNRVPRVERYKIFSIPFNPGKFFAAVKIAGWPHWYHMGLVAASYGIDVPMMYDTHAAAESDAKKVLQISSRKES